MQIMLEKEYSEASPLTKNKIILKDENKDNKNNINLYFKIMENDKEYPISVLKDLQFIKVIHKLFNVYPELEFKK